MFAITSFSHSLTNHKKINQCCFDYINLNYQKQKCFTLFFHLNDVLYKHYYNYNKNDDR